MVVSIFIYLEKQTVEKITENTKNSESYEYLAKAVVKN